VSGVDLLLLSLSFPDLAEGTDAIRIGDADDVTIRFVTFSGMGGVAVRQTADIGDLTIEHNELSGVGAIAELGCAEGDCATGAVLVEDNLLQGGGSGLTLLSPASATLRDNMLLGIAGVGIRVSGGDAVLEGNVVQALTTGIDVRSGPALLRSQIVMAPVGIVAPGDGGGIRIVGNTVIAAGGDPLRLEGWGPGPDLRLADNAIDGEIPDVHGAEATGNVACLAPEDCFTDAETWDFYPSPGGLLREGAGTRDPELLSDWCGLPRQNPPTPGALEAFGDPSYGGLPSIAKDDIDCEVVGEVPPPAGDPLQIDPLVLEVETCGCGPAPAGAMATWWLAAAIGALRTRGRPSTRRTARRDLLVPGPPARRR